MAVSVFDSAVWSAQFGDAEIAAFFTDTAELRAMLRVEAALASAQASLGRVPGQSATAIARAAEDMPLDRAALAEGTARSGLPITALVAALRAHLPEHADWVHRGATSQDIVDTGLALRLKPALAVLEARLRTLLEALAARARAERTTVIAARTRGQIAVPTTLGARMAAWGMPLLRHHARLEAVRTDCLVVTLGGAAGTRAALGGQADALTAHMGATLGLSVPKIPPHSARDATAALAAWLALVTGSLGKIGQDLLLLGQSEVGEVTCGAGGGSSAMPHKQNPVAAETLVALARHNAAAAGEALSALVHASDRDGAAWAGEWLSLPRMMVATGATLRHAQAMLDAMTVHPERIAETFARDRGLCLAETAVVRLGATMPRAEAAALVADACARVRTRGSNLAAELTALHPAIPWTDVLTPAGATGDAPHFADRFVAAVARLA